MTERARDGKGVGVEIERVKRKLGGGGFSRLVLWFDSVFS
jgi:hypothetical protein